MKAKLCLVLLICILFMSGCGYPVETYDSSYTFSDDESSLKIGQTYTILDVREIEQSVEGYGGDFPKRSEHILSLIVENTETKERSYETVKCYDRLLSDSYKHMAVLVTGDTFKYTGDYTYELIK